MCGIVGVIGANAPSKVFNGLKALEYRGYDSWGIASLNNGSFAVEKKAGRIGSASFNTPDSTISIGHTRWATHGKVNETNAHPHLSENSKIAIVHNGIVENYTSLKKQLISKGFSFRSETDTEVIANLIQDKLKDNTFIEAVRLACLELEGSYAFVALHADNDKEMVCTRNGSPMVLGIGDDILFAASDVTAFLKHTNKAVFLEDLSIASLSDSVSVFSIKTGEKIPFQTKEISWSFEQAKKGDYPHFMLKEMHEQPDVILRSYEQPVDKLSHVASLIKDSKNVFLVGCGSSYHACITGSYFFSSIAKQQITPVLASEFENTLPFIDSNSLVIGISQSGETIDLISALKSAKDAGAKIASIVNVMDSTVMRISDVSLIMNAGPEICVLSTKSYVSQLSILFLLSYSLIGKGDEAKKLLSGASDSVKNFLSTENENLKQIAKKLSSSNDIFVIGRQSAFPAALESALKIKEVSYIHAEGFAGAELKHGTIALIEDNTPAITLITPETESLAVSNAIEMKSRGAFLIGIGPEKHSDFDYFIELPDIGKANPIPLVVPVQLLSYYLALERNCDPDKPRNLAKSVTVK